MVHVSVVNVCVCACVRASVRACMCVVSQLSSDPQSTCCQEPDGAVLVFRRSPHAWLDGGCLVLLPRLLSLLRPEVSVLGDVVVGLLWFSAVLERRLHDAVPSDVLTGCGS